MRDEKGEEMHKSKGNAIWFDDAAEIIGVDVMRWLFSTVNPSQNLNFGYNVTRRGSPSIHLAALELIFLLRHLCPVGRFRSDRCIDKSATGGTVIARSLDHFAAESGRSARSRATQAYDPNGAANEIEHFVVEELSNWYIRRNRRRFWKTEGDRDKRPRITRCMNRSSRFRGCSLHSCRS